MPLSRVPASMILGATLLSAPQLLLHSVSALLADPATQPAMPWRFVVDDPERLFGQDSPVSRQPLHHLHGSRPQEACGDWSLTPLTASCLQQSRAQTEIFDLSCRHLGPVGPASARNDFSKALGNALSSCSLSLLSTALLPINSSSGTSSTAALAAPVSIS